MGKIVEEVALSRGHKIASIIDPQSKKATHKHLDKKAVEQADVCIDFTHPLAVLENIEKVCGFGKNIVVGTTGWYDKIDVAKKIVLKSKTGLIYSSNFSLGMNIMFRLVESAAKIFDKFDNYDVGGFELHHNKKSDSPSGTAKTLSEILVSNIKRKKKINYEKVDGAIQPQELHFASLRTGFMPGLHKIFFDSQADTIEISHSARDRSGFALGAVMAAEWLVNRKGFYSIDDFMKEIVK